MLAATSHPHVERADNEARTRAKSLEDSHATVTPYPLDKKKWDADHSARWKPQGFMEPTTRTPGFYRALTFMV